MTVDRLALMRTGVPLALGSALLFGASTPLAKMLSGSIDPWLLAGIQGIGGQIPAPSTGKPAPPFFSRDCVMDLRVPDRDRQVTGGFLR
jgi:drug/metabolite transporter (DMT)-like permease